jgi:hypothetical protein
MLDNNLSLQERIVYLKQSIHDKKLSIRKIRNIRNVNAIKANKLQHEKRTKLKTELLALQSQLDSLEHTYQIHTSNNPEDYTIPKKEDIVRKSGGDLTAHR